MTVGLRTAAGSAVAGIEDASVQALMKLQQVLPSRLRHRTLAFEAALQSPARGPLVDPEVLTLLASACRDREVVRCDYKAHNDRSSRRRTELYRLVSHQRRWYSFAGPLLGDGEHYRDPDTMERGLKAHSSTQDALADLLSSRGLTPLSAFDKLCNFDLAWHFTDGTVGVAEVKSNTEENDAFQIRHGLGQVLDYGHRIKGRGFSPMLFLVLERKPQGAHWGELCSAHNVTLTWGPSFTGVV